MCHVPDILRKTLTVGNDQFLGEKGKVQRSNAEKFLDLWGNK
jgi:hypothetical protein